MKTQINILKKAAILCMLVLTTPAVMAQMALENTSPPVAVIDFAVETVDYGTITQNSDGQRTITFTNTGDAPLVLTEVKSSCGCTVPSFSKTPVLPNETGEIVIKYNTSKVGAFTKTLTVISNASETAKKIKIKGIVTKAS